MKEITKQDKAREWKNMMWTTVIKEEEGAQQRVVFCVPLIENDLMNLHLINTIDLYIPAAKNGMASECLKHFYALAILWVHFLTACLDEWKIICKFTVLPFLTCSLTPPPPLNRHWKHKRRIIRLVQQDNNLEIERWRENICECVFYNLLQCGVNAVPDNCDANYVDYHLLISFELGFCNSTEKETTSGYSTLLFLVVLIWFFYRQQSHKERISGINCNPIAEVVVLITVHSSSQMLFII